MNKDMCEEEIIKICNKLIADFKHFQEMREKDKELNIYQWNSYDDIFKEYKQAIQGLLDLYQKEKEKNEKLENELMEKELAIKEIQEQYYVSKDKIRELLNKLEISDDLEAQIALPYIRELLKERN